MGLAGNHIPRPQLRTGHTQEVPLITELTAVQKNDNFRGLKHMDGNPSLDTTTRKGSRSHKETKRRAELPDLPLMAMSPLVHDIFLSLIVGFWFSHTKVCSEGRRRRAKGSVEGKEGVGSRGNVFIHNLTT